MQVHALSGTSCFFAYFVSRVCRYTHDYQIILQVHTYSTNLKILSQSIEKPQKVV